MPVVIDSTLLSSLTATSFPLRPQQKHFDKLPSNLLRLSAIQPSLSAHPVHYRGQHRGATSIPTRTIGKTSAQVSQVSFGSAPLGDLFEAISEETAQPIRWEGRTVSSASEEVTVAANQGCRFYQRCPHAMARCLTSPPPGRPVGEKQFAACYLYAGERKAVAL